MPRLIALDVAILPPPPVSHLAMRLSAALAGAESDRLRLGPECLPHVTLTQQFIPADRVEAAVGLVETVVAGVEPLPLTVIGATARAGTISLVIEMAPALSDLHRRLMDGLRPFERRSGTVDAFADGDARGSDVAWVVDFRRQSSFAAFHPHITLGHAAVAPAVDPLTFESTTIAACQLGRFCSCRKVLKIWTLARK